MSVKKELRMKLDKFFKKYFEDYMEINPLTATFIGINKYNHVYPNYLSDQVIEKNKKFYEDYLDKLYEIKDDIYGKISDEENYYIDVLEYRLKDNIQSFNHPFHLIPLNQFDNFILDYVEMCSGKGYLPLKTKKDFNNLILKTSDFLIFCDTAICRMREGMDKKITLPKEVMRRVVEQLKDLKTTKDYILDEKTVPESIYEEYKKIFEGKFTKMINKFIKFLENEYIPVCRDKLGLKFMPQGKEMYKYLVESYTNNRNISIDWIQKIGLKECTRIQKEIEDLFKNNDMDVPKTSENFLFDSKEDVIKDYERVREIINKKLVPKYFDIKISHDYLIKKVPKFKEENDAGAYYMMPSYDNKRKGTFYLNMNNLADHQTYSTMSLSLHEGNPGHHFQLTYCNDNDIPDFIKYCDDETIYVEGWALYCESLTHDFLKNSTKKEDIMFRYGCYNYEIMRAARLLVDTGIHYYGWNYKKCFDFMKSFTNFSDNEIEVEIYRYTSYPGQALTYKLGEIHFQELRDNFLKKNKNLKLFHREVLKRGSSPMNLLHKIVKSSQKKM